jgi:hypothetical protein
LDADIPFSLPRSPAGIPESPDRWMLKKQTLIFYYVSLIFNIVMKRSYTCMPSGYFFNYALKEW